MEYSNNIFCRSELLLGSESTEKLKNAKVAVFGIGGVGSFTAEALVRGGVGHLMLVDDDTVAPSNLNRQLIALHSTVGKYKTDVIKQRALDINPSIIVDSRPIRYDSSTASDFDFAKFDYIVDAIDSVTSKILLIQQAKEAGVPVISSMGAGNKLDPTRFEVADISKTSVCPLARVMRHELKKRGITDVKVVYSKEESLTPSQCDEEKLPGKRQTTGSVSFVPSVAGLIIAGEVIKDICKK